MSQAKVLHTMIRVGDLDKSIEFYTKVLGMNLIRRSENEQYEYSLAFVGYGDETQGATTIELTYNWGKTEYDLGTGFGHIALGFDDIYATCEQIKAAGGLVTREPGPVKGGTTHIAFVKDPDGYMIELIQNRQASAALNG